MVPPFSMWFKAPQVSVSLRRCRFPPPLLEPPSALQYTPTKPSIHQSSVKHPSIFPCVPLSTSVPLLIQFYDFTSQNTNYSYWDLSRPPILSVCRFNIQLSNINFAVQDTFGKPPRTHRTVLIITLLPHQIELTCLGPFNICPLTALEQLKHRPRFARADSYEIYHFLTHSCF